MPTQEREASGRSREVSPTSEGASGPLPARPQSGSRTGCVAPRSEDGRQQLQLPERQPLTARLAAAGSRRAEFEALLHAAPEGAPPDELRRLVTEENVVAKGSATSRTKVWRQLRQTYLLDPSVPEFSALVEAMRATSAPSDRGLLLFLLLARTDRLFRELTLATISPQLAHPGAPVPAEAAQAALGRLLEGSAGRSWTRETLVTVRQHALSALKDFGVLAGGTKKKIGRVRPGPQVTLLAARLAQLEGLPPRRIPTSAWFRLLGADEEGAWDLLYAAARAGVLRARRQADVVDIELPPLPAGPDPARAGS